MSLLEELHKQKTKLKPTETIVTRQDGQKFKETKTSTVKLAQKSAGYVIDTKPDDVPAQVIENLYLGSQDCCELSILQSYGIINVLSVGIEAPVKFPLITYKFVEMLDLPDTHLNNYLKNCTNFIKSSLECNKKVLVHCNAGVSRSASVVIGFLILEKGFSFDRAYNIVKMARNCIRPNDGFINQLKSLV